MYIIFTVKNVCQTAKQYQLNIKVRYEAIF